MAPFDDEELRHMRFPIKQVALAFFALAFAIVILERAGGFSLAFGSVTEGLGGLFTKLTPAPRGPSFDVRRGGR